MTMEKTNGISLNIFRIPSVITDAHGKIISANKQFEILFGIKIEEGDSLIKLLKKKAMKAMFFGR